MTWDTELAALQTWVAAASGLSASNVRWSGQGGMRPATPWISLRVIAETVPGPDWCDTQDANPVVLDAEIEYKIRGSRTGTLSVQCFAGAAVGGSSPFGVLRQLHVGAQSPIKRSALAAAGVGLGNLGSVQDIPGIINTTNFEPRATMLIQFFTASEVTETNTFIETVEMTGTVAA